MCLFKTVLGMHLLNPENGVSFVLRSSLNIFPTNQFINLINARKIISTNLIVFKSSQVFISYFIYCLFDNSMLSKLKYHNFDEVLTISQELLRRLGHALEQYNDNFLQF